VKYPSAISSFAHIAAQAKKKKIAVFLDYDGTLSPIVDDPDRAIMSDAVINANLLSITLLCSVFCVAYSMMLKRLFFLLIFQMRSAVKDVASYFPTAIISGRSRDKVKS